MKVLRKSDVTVFGKIGVVENREQENWDSQGVDNDNNNDDSKFKEVHVW